MKELLFFLGVIMVLRLCYWSKSLYFRDTEIFAVGVQLRSAHGKRIG